MKRWFLLGSLLSLGLVGWILYRLDWELFFATFARLQPVYLFPVILLMLFSMSMRSLRWNWLSNMHARHWPDFWRAFNIGYLGNIIYPARAGEVLRIAAIHRLVKIPLARATTSAILDRFLDLFAVGLALLWLMQVHGSEVLGPSLPYALGGLLASGLLILTLILIFDRWVEERVQQLDPGEGIGHLICDTMIHGLEILRQFKRSHAGPVAIALSLAAVTSDSLLAWTLLTALDWQLPLDAGFTVFVFLALGSSLPSAPGAIGIYQIGCVLALGLYGISESEAVAWSLVLQLSTFGVILMTGGWVVLHYGLRQKR
jgi:uncharacterized protein (TIRG00374 family)